MNWLRLAYAAAALAVDEWRARRAAADLERRRGQEFRNALGGRSPVFVDCDRCGAKVRADLRSMAEHRCPGSK